LAKEVDSFYTRGLITRLEVKNKNEQIWSKIISDLDKVVWDNLPEDNPVKILVNQGSTKASRDQVRQLAGMKGLIYDPTGRIVEVPIFGNFKLGLSASEYFIGSRGARKGLVDKGLKTADAGYLTRRLVDVSQDVLVREEDCGTDEGREMIVGKVLFSKHLGKELSVGFWQRM